MKVTLCSALLALLGPAALVAQVAQVAETVSPARAAAVITAQDFAWRIGVMAHDSMQGRDTPSPGLEKTAQWIAAEFRRFGLQGGAEDGSFIQRYPLVATAVDGEAFSLGASGGAKLRLGADVFPMRGSGDVDATAPLVVVSGPLDPSALQGGGLNGKHVAVILPAGDAMAGRRALLGALGALGTSGAVSVMVVNADGQATWERAAAAALRPSVTWGGAEARAGGAGRVPMLQIREGALAGLLQGTGVSLTALRGASTTQVTPLPGVTLTLTQRLRATDTSAPNVVGILPGSDPVLKDEYVVFSAHMDHVGMEAPDERGDSIFNGADDNASGTAAVMQVAMAMAAMDPAPRRSVIFLLVSGEERGLWGSRHYADNPSVPVDRLVANINADMVGRNWPDTIVAIGKEHSDLGETLNRVNRRHPELNMEAIDDLWPEQRFYFRSDHYSFARKGVPVLFFFNGVHEDYHERTDVPERIDTDKASRIARLMFYLGVEVAGADQRPRWNPESYRQIVTGGR